MNMVEQAPDFDFDSFDMAEFDKNEAFQASMVDVMTNAELALEEKVQRMEFIVTEAKGELYRDFVDFRQMANAAQMHMACDHALKQAAKSSDTLSDMFDEHGGNDGHEHGSDLLGNISKHDHDHEHEYETDPKTGEKKKKKKKKRGWFGVYY